MRMMRSEIIADKNRNTGNRVVYYSPEWEVMNEKDFFITLRSIFNTTNLMNMLVPKSVIRAAMQSDALHILACVQLAYKGYVSSLGMKPNPMLDDYSEVIETSQVSVLVVADRIVGVVVLEITDEGILVNSPATKRCAL
ncbi:MAG: hypothetical protein H7232_02930 [Aeromicrobium sp.]|nr:hypothetical protein [Burkholderiales bacterium]